MVPVDEETHVAFNHFEYEPDVVQEVCPEFDHFKRCQD
jgi:hypothetical protein